MNILLGITGSISAYKAPQIARECIKRGHDVRVVMTPSATRFIPALTLQNLTKSAVIVEMFDEASQSGGSWHIHLARWCDVMLVAPCSASTLGKIANGLCDTALTMLALALPPQTPLVLAPAMDSEMWIHPATRRNIQTLKSDGVAIIPPAEGELASGFSGVGRLPEIDFILQTMFEHVQDSEKKIGIKADRIAEITEMPTVRLNDAVEKDAFTAELELIELKRTLAANSTHFLAGKTVLITAGPTYEKIDDVRFIGNFSSGKMGFALAEKARQYGANVLLISGPVSLATPEDVERINVVSAQEMFEQTIAHADSADILILSAAVADFTPVHVHAGKVKKSHVGGEWSIELRETNDILATLGANKKPHQFLIGFALEAENELDNAQKKLASKRCDMLILNSANKPQSGFGGDENTITILSPSAEPHTFPPMSKSKCAEEILRNIPHKIGE